MHVFETQFSFFTAWDSQTSKTNDWHLLHAEKNVNQKLKINLKKSVFGSLICRYQFFVLQILNLNNWIPKKSQYKRIYILNVHQGWVQTSRNRGFEIYVRIYLSGSKYFWFETQRFSAQWDMFKSKNSLRLPTETHKMLKIL